MKKIRFLILTSLFSLFVSCPVLSADNYKLDKHYQELSAEVLKSPLVRINAENDKILVIEFFSYACPACYAVSDQVRKWSQNLPKDVEFQRVPVEFHTGWDMYARAYYAAEFLQVLDKIDANMFASAHNRAADLLTDDNMRKFFEQNAGVSAEDFNKTFRSFAVDRALERAKMLMRDYYIFSVPSVVVGNKYATDLAKVGAIDNFVPVIEHLIEKRRN